ncbi:outer membrane lipoprotein LolB [Ignatzschineria ureiclastica]|uniref:Outer-membrane lipoprotein LolB n=1 Tax=Ignatzschineria ureiclastica TaxID=472582 RepID=A0A2U2ADA3_9GAMM|nr:lipoprotein insertase outer membrane protein LolB [Ignatzschineria ureiclastica]PWD80633.1 outer membrane lipoprotein LolB [Ignatzschineria ureiclastica]GGZ95627.1 hypothetical protein GCM10007162_09980 [Ignatzschineria ureiclastica]
MKRLKIIPFSVALFTLAACTVPMYQSLDEAQDYKVFGRTAIKHPTQSGQVSFAIEQAKNEAINIIIQGPFAQGRVDIAIDDQETSITIDEETFKDQNPDRLFANLTGVDWPVSGSQQWIKGKTTHPDTKIVFDDKGLPKQFKEDGWTVSYQEWIEKNGMQLPLKMTLTRGNDIRLRFLIDNWIIH